jgi:NAD(P)-dependent dehydrogenase (short-subunit alcohol dehydrogenase family)
MKHTNKISRNGSSRGLGRNIALQLAQLARPVVTYRQRKEEGEAVVAEIQALDVRRPHYNSIRPRFRP